MSLTSFERSIGWLAPQFYSTPQSSRCQAPDIFRARVFSARYSPHAGPARPTWTGRATVTLGRGGGLGADNRSSTRGTQGKPTQEVPHRDRCPSGAPAVEVEAWVDLHHFDACCAKMFPGESDKVRHLTSRQAERVRRADT